ncbi:hypothetical protein BJF81_06200 [Ornithinimicrobium sp. CNJ-824]|nr:hypothetical protein BJF81_06200 [Ornithinimicrobium sp. CNJ-824]
MTRWHARLVPGLPPPEPFRRDFPRAGASRTGRRHDFPRAGPDRRTRHLFPGAGRHPAGRWGTRTQEEAPGSRRT